MREHTICRESGALIFEPTEGERAIDQIRRVASAMLKIVISLEAGERAPRDAIEDLEKLAEGQ